MSKTAKTLQIFLRVAVGFFVACLILGAAGWWVSGRMRAPDLDTAVRAVMRLERSPMWTALLVAVTRLGSTVWLWVMGGAAGLAFVFLKWWRPLGLLIVTMAGQAVLHLGFKWLVHRPRAGALIDYPAAESFSFPSGHAMGSLCLFGSVAWAVANRLETPAAKIGVWAAAGILIFLVGFSRVYIGVHFPTDVLAGWLAAAVWTSAVMSNDTVDL